MVEKICKTCHYYKDPSSQYVCQYWEECAKEGTCCEWAEGMHQHNLLYRIQALEAKGGGI